MNEYYTLLVEKAEKLQFLTVWPTKKVTQKKKATAVRRMLKRKGRGISAMLVCVLSVFLHLLFFAISSSALM